MRDVSHGLEPTRFSGDALGGYFGHHMGRRDTVARVGLEVANIIGQPTQLWHAVDTNADPTTSGKVDADIGGVRKNLRHLFLHDRN